MPSPLVFLHLSDIHFAKPRHGAAYDLDSDLRDALEADAAAQRRTIAQPHAILISGDVAFSGDASQYDQAKRWLDDKLCPSVGIDGGAVRCVPGNHDVNQTLTSKPSYKDLRLKLRTCPVEDIDKLVDYHLAEPALFYEPISQYNDFAFEFGCDIDIDRPFWRSQDKDKFTLSDGSTLRLYGLNSVLISDDQDHIDTGKMILTSFQCAIPHHDPAEVNLIICHHPFDWLRDADNVEEKLNPRCSIQLVGHKHRQKLVTLNGTLLRVAAGAVHPSRREPNWEPRYNWLVIDVDQQQGRRLRVRVYPRVWSAAHQRFDADRNNCDPGQDHVTHYLRLAELPQPLATLPEVPVMNVPQAAVTSAPVPDTPPTPDSRGSIIVDRERTLARRYFQLGYVDKMKIATDLGLLEDLDDKLSEHERQRKQLDRARQKNILAQLWDKVNAAHNDGRYPHNPFS